MEELIELLNEFCKEKKYNTEWYEWKFWPKVKPYEELTQWVVNWIIIGKHYGFIKWLVDNDKIDRDRILKEDWVFRKKFYDLEFARIEDRMLMLLSISDTPIQDLCVWLK